jgi:hypothetical protein
MCMRARPSKGLGCAVLDDRCDKWYQSRSSRLRVHISVRALDVRSCVAHGAGTEYMAIELDP